MNVKDISIKTQFIAGFLALPAFIIVLGWKIFFRNERVRQLTKTTYHHPIQVKQATGLPGYNNFSLQQDSSALLTAENVPMHFDALLQNKALKTETGYLLQIIQEQPPRLPQHTPVLALTACITTSKKKAIRGHHTDAYSPKRLTNKIIF